MAFRTDGASYRVAVSRRVSTDIYEVLELRDGVKTWLLNKKSLKIVNNINVIIAFSVLDMNVGRQTETNRLFGEILDESNNEWRWIEATLGFPWLSLVKIQW